MNDAVLRPLADAMFSAAAGVVGSLANRTASAGATSPAAGDASIRVDGELIATLTTIPANGVSFVARYAKRDLGRIVEMMLGTPPSEGEMDAMQLSIVAETVAQISSAMGEALATALGVSSLDIHSEVPNEAGKYPPPPFTSFAAPIALEDGYETEVTIDFDGVAAGKIAGKPEAVAAPEPRTAARPPATAPQPAAFTPVAPTPIRTAPPGHANLELVHDIPLEISAVLGQTELSLREVVAMQTGSVFELDKLSTDPVDLYVNNILIARGEVVVVDDKFAVKISELNPVVEKV